MADPNEHDVLVVGYRQIRWPMKKKEKKEEKYHSVLLKLEVDLS